MMKKPIFETVLSKPKDIIDKKGTVKFTTILQSLDKPGENGRIYPFVLLEKQLKKQENKIKNKMWYGELDHPNTNDDDRIYTVSLKEQSHSIVDYSIDSDKVVGTIETLPTPNGQIVKQLILNDNTLGISLRQLGTLKENNTGYQLVEDLDLVTYDIVSDPSFTNQTFNKERLVESIDYVLKSSNSMKNELFRIAFMEEVKTLFMKLGLDDDKYIRKFISYLENN